mmetsp:Transcript_30731/g.27938  ORF Transcript_30731/g.27938 Transcript_30731/m.27938 type:complete len:85 (-) Transcript_30731:1631-1885(-)
MLFEKKLKNNQYNEEEDAFDELLGENAGPKKKKDDLALLDEDDDNPVWEDVDTKQVIQDIQKKDFLGMLPQDKKAIFGENTTKN